MDHFGTLKDGVNRVTDVLLTGYATEANHTLKSKVSRTEVEDMINGKFDHTRGKDLEKSLKESNKLI